MNNAAENPTLANPTHASLLPCSTAKRPFCAPITLSISRRCGRERAKHPGRLRHHGGGRPGRVPGASGGAQEAAGEVGIPQNNGIQMSEAITGDGAAVFRHACSMDLKALSRSASAADM
jgi:hypothetical protein